MISSLEKLERQLAREAAAFGSRKTEHKAEPRQALWKICGLTGLPPTADGFHSKATEILNRMLAAQRRWARTAHPAYDLNRHLSIREALAVLEGNEATLWQNGKGRISSQISGP